ncbi:L-galactonate dehydratase [Verticillium dahliae VDG1]|nr:L-galactonate dehydratase [Verticillium dahliae VDG1]
MAARFPLRWLQALRPIRLQPARRSYHVTAPLRSAADAAPSTPPFLATLKADLKTAMRAKDAQRLAKENAQAKVLQDYIENSGVKQVTEAEIVELISRAIDEVKAASADGKSSLGAVMKGVQGALKGRALEVDMARVSELVKEAINKA